MRGGKVLLEISASQYPFGGGVDVPHGCTWIDNLFCVHGMHTQYYTCNPYI
jgi:hypothetical protein